MPAYAFCPECLGVFESRQFDFGDVSRCSENCIFCGAQTHTASDPNELKPTILNALHEKMLASSEVKKIRSVLLQLQQQKISINVAEAQIEKISPGLGIRICGAIRRNGRAAILTFVAVFGLWAQFQMVATSKEANEISQRALDHIIEQSSSTEDLPESKPSRPQMQEAHPNRPVHKNRKIRRAEKAEKRRDK